MTAEEIQKALAEALDSLNQINQEVLGQILEADTFIEYWDVDSAQYSINQMFLAVNRHIEKTK